MYSFLCSLGAMDATLDCQDLRLLLLSNFKLVCPLLACASCFKQCHGEGVDSCRSSPMIPHTVWIHIPMVLSSLFTPKVPRFISREFLNSIVFQTL